MAPNRRQLCAGARHLCNGGRSSVRFPVAWHRITSLATIHPHLRTMKRLFTLSSWTYLFLGTGSLFAQLGPLNWTRPVAVEANGIFLVWHDAPEIGNQIHQKTYSYTYADANLPMDERISATPGQTAPGAGAAPFTDVATGKFLHGAREGVVSVWGPGPSGITMAFPRFDTSAMAWTEMTEYQITGDIQADRIHVRTLDVDGDQLDECVVAYLNTEDSLHVELYNVDSALQPTFMGGFCDFQAMTASDQKVRIAIATGDFNGDGTEELAVLRNLGPSGYYVDLELRIYAFGSGTWALKSTYANFEVGFNLPLQHFEMTLVPGHFMDGPGQQLALVASLFHGSSFRKVQVGVVSISSDLQTITGGSYFTSSFTTEGVELGADAANLYGDERDELVVVAGKNAFLMHMTTGDSLYVRPAQPLDYDGFAYGDNGTHPVMHDHIRLTDVDQDGHIDLVSVYDALSSGNGGFDVRVHAIDSLNGFTLKGRLQYDEDEPINNTDPPQYAFRPYSVAVGNFSGLNYTIGEPTHHVSAALVNPIVILNAPPVHFDMLDSTPYDLNSCFNGGDCDFGATYRKSSTTSIEVSTTVRSDWAISSGYSVSGSVEVGVEPMGIGVAVSVDYERHLLLNYGRHFSLTDAASSTVTVGVEVTAREDDRIYSTLTQYDVWEYPLYHGDETVPRRTIATLEPLNVAATWYPSKSYFAVQYVPDHEVGNVLSYPAFTALTENPDLEQPIAGNYDTDSFVLDGSSNYDWYLETADFTSSQADTSSSGGVDLGFGIGGFRFDGDYSQGRAQTYLTTVTDLIDLNVHLGSMDMGVGDAKYTVTPYAYWNKNGALVVDYAARPEIAPPGFPPTWWQQQYGQLPDPTFVLPWKLDPEKGFAISDEAKRKQTKDIIFDKAYPMPGDTVLITARVRNFSLLSTPAPVTVSFYLGDPDEDGTPLVGLGGTNTVSTDGPITAQGRADVSISWPIPPDLSAYPRIYAVLDEDNAMVEVHEGNNTGFNVLGWASGQVGVDEPGGAPPNTGLLCYPNPFLATTTIAVAMSTSGHATLTILDPLGREVRHLLDADLPAGSRTLQFDANDLPDGLYIAVLRTEAGIRTARLMLAR